MKYKTHMMGPDNVLRSLPTWIILWFMIFLILGDKQLRWVTAAWKLKNEAFPCISVSSCGSQYFLHSLFLLSCRVILQVFLTGVSQVEKIYEKFKFHDKFGDILFLLAALKLCQDKLKIFHLQQSGIKRRAKFSDAHFCSPGPPLV